MKAQTKTPYFTAYGNVEIEVDPDDLHADGWHHESECGKSAVKDAELHVLPAGDVRGLAAAVASLHRQAHSGQGRSVRLCHEEPCRSLNLEQLRLADG
jgi:hypothetical protein